MRVNHNNKSLKKRKKLLQNKNPVNLSNRNPSLQSNLQSHHIQLVNLQYNHQLNQYNLSHQFNQQLDLLHYQDSHQLFNKDSDHMFNQDSHLLFNQHSNLNMDILDIVLNIYNHHIILNMVIMDIHLNKVILVHICEI